MPLKSILIAPSTSFWRSAARALLIACREPSGDASQCDFADWRVVLPTLAHTQQLKVALSVELGGTFVLPQFCTLSCWLMMLSPLSNVVPSSERLMRLYGELRQHGWLKKVFAARRNTDLLPLVQTLLALSDELTQALLPSLHAACGAAADLEQRWQHALEQLSPDARNILSDETQLVWSIWKNQLDADDAIAARFSQALQLAAQANQPLAWISSVAPEPLEQVFLDAYAARQPVLTITLDWRAPALSPTYSIAWPEMVEAATDGSGYLDEASHSEIGQIAAPALSTELALCPAQSVEDEAVQGAQMVIDWLHDGKTNLAIVAQDRVVARRIRALLERAQIHVVDETDWKLSTTRAASAIAAWFDVVAARAETTALLDLLKSPFVLNHAFSNLLHDAQDSLANKSALVMKIELLLRRANVLGEWRTVINALSAAPAEQKAVSLLAQQASQFSGRKTLRDWIVTTNSTLDVLGISAALRADSAGQQILQLLQNIAPSGNNSGQDYVALFSFSEWRALVNLQLDDTSFISAISDWRVVMLPLHGARLRTFDAVLMVGADANHLPSQPQERLFFANKVRRELALATRESRQRQQLRDVIELLVMNPRVVLSWQAYKDGAPNPVSPWIQRLQLTLARHAVAALPQRRATIAVQGLQPIPSAMPAPAAAQLTPKRLSASGYNSFIACPYQFFAGRMLGLAALDELSNLPEKRDYGGWLHQILGVYHETLRDQPCPPEQREALLVDISKKLFDNIIAMNPAALGYYARWQKVIAAYVVWSNEHEASGWRFMFHEQAHEKTLPLADRKLTLHGRIDRIDENDAGERAVLDYKTNNLIVLNKKLKDHEDHQLAFYGLLSDRPVAAAHYVALETTKNKVGDVSAPDYEQAQGALAAQITINMQAIARGVGLPANGSESVCQYCDVRGLCRKGAW